MSHDGRRRWIRRALFAGLATTAWLVPLALAQHQHPSDGAAAGATPSAEPKILFWYDPMHPQFRSDKPGPSPDCGMEMVPMYADEGAAPQNLPAGVHISPLKQQLAGVRTVPATRRSLTRTIRTVGMVVPDEGRVRKVRVRFAGWIEKVLVNFTGQLVQAGEPIVEIYSPDLVATQTEYLIARRGHQELHQSPFAEAARSSESLLDAARRRLVLWDVTPQQIRALEETGKPQRSITLGAPVSGHVMMKEVYQGQYVTPEMDLYTITDLSRVWVLLDVYEYEIGAVRAGMPVALHLRAYPSEVFAGTVAYVSPFLEGKTRTNKVRVELDNPDLRLKPEMYATADIQVVLEDRLVVPADAVLDAGTKQVVFVATGDGHFEPREVRLGERGDDYVEVLNGVAAGEPVVIAANFMVDSESQLKAALNAIGGGHVH